MIEEGKQAPDFELQTDAGETVKLSDFRGRPVVLYFYPKDDTPGCTRQACGIRDAYAEFERAGAAVFGISADTQASHERFKSKYSLPFTLLADPEKKVTKQYGVLKTYMGIMEMARRDTFIIDPKGRIAKHYENVEPEGHSQVVLDEIKALKAANKATG